ncbi:MAG: isoprenylcysteine carboxylmethyltransferase family protein [Pseudomonadota bacterium]
MPKGLKWVDIPPVWLVAFLVVGWLVAQALGTQSDWRWRLEGGSLVAIGVGLMVWAVVTMARARTTVIPHMSPDALVTDGPFRFSRNPIYLGDGLVLAGAVLWWGAWPLLVLVPVFGWVITARFIRAEEARLISHFGPQFHAWAAKTRRWI